MKSETEFKLWLDTEIEEAMNSSGVSQYTDALTKARNKLAEIKTIFIYPEIMNLEEKVNELAGHDLKAVDFEDEKQMAEAITNWTRGYIYRIKNSI